MAYNGIIFPKLIKGQLVRRYKRFLADVTLADGSMVTAHCPNTGSMRGCSEPGQPVFLSVSFNPKRKLKYTWELIQMPSSLVGINTQVPNRLVKESILHGCIEALEGYTDIKSEVKTSEGTRLDLYLSGAGLEDCFIEIKNCTLVENEVARFPDAVTLRGKKHLEELEQLAEKGHRTIVFFLIQRMDAKRFSPAVDIDPDYSQTLARAVGNGVEAMAVDTVIDVQGVRIGRPLPVVLEQV